MDDIVRIVDDELLVVADAGEDLETLVADIMNDPELADLELTRPRAVAEPDGVAMLHSSVSGAIQIVKAKYPDVRPNYVLVQMTHGRVLPISYPRPTKPLPLPDPGTSDVEVLIIDTPLVGQGPINDRVDGPVKGLADPSDTPTSALHGSFVAGIVHMQEPRAIVRLRAISDPNDDGFVSDWELACLLSAIATSQKVPDIISLSLGATTGGSGEPVALARAVTKARERKIRLFAAAGNNGQAGAVVYPAAFEGVHAVGAQAAEPRPADWSNGALSPLVDFWAPGVSIASTTVDHDGPITFREELDETSHYKDLPPPTPENVHLSGFACWDGTSFATPIVAAACATELIENPGDDPLPKLRKRFGAPDNDAGFAGTYAVARCSEGAGTQQAAS